MDGSEYGSGLIPKRGLPKANACECGGQFNEQCDCGDMNCPWILCFWCGASTEPELPTPKKTFERTKEMTINPHDAITKMTSEEYHDFMHGARQQQQREEDHFTAAHAERGQNSISQAVADAKHQLASRRSVPLGTLQILIEYVEEKLAAEEARESAEYEYYENGQAQP